MLTDRLGPPRIRRTLADWLADWAHRLGVGAFSQMPDDKLADHCWAAESALLRAMRCSDVASVAELSTLTRAMEREMRRRGLV